MKLTLLLVLLATLSSVSAFSQNAKKKAGYTPEDSLTLIHAQSLVDSSVIAFNANRAAGRSDDSTIMRTFRVRAHVRDSIVLAIHKKYNREEELSFPSRNPNRDVRAESVGTTKVYDTLSPVKKE
jgi:hypothetical protein